MENYKNKIEKAKGKIAKTDYVLIGAGSGLSTSAGIEYSGKRFENNFKEFIKKYNFTDMYTSSFYDFETEEEKWAYWAKHMYMNDIGMEATKLYQDVLKLVENKEYFVLTTNVDDQFFKAGFDKNKIFATQGSYAKIQCSHACHDTLYDATNLVKEMIENTVDCKIPTKLVPLCPVCGEKMETNLRKDAYFVQDDNWYKQSKRYEDFLDKVEGKNVVLLEIGVGFNTPGIIRLPFEKMTYENPNIELIRINKNYPQALLDIENKIIAFEEDASLVINDLNECKNM